MRTIWRPSVSGLHRLRAIGQLIRSVREWQYPTNHVDPATGVPASAVSWAVAARADKNRFFTEPGFIFGVTIARPKVYYSKQSGSLTSVMNNAISWLPAILSDDPYTSVKPFAAGSHPLPAALAGSATRFASVSESAKLTNCSP